MPQPSSHRWLKPASDYGPLAVFFAAYWLGDLLTATAALMAATALALAASLVLERRVPLLPLITAAVVGIFGGLTLWLADETFIKMKPTIVQLLFAAILFGGLLFGKPLLKPLLESAWKLRERGWTLLTFRFAVFFLVMAGLNELVWRTQSTDVWVNFKVFGIILITFLFTLAQVPMIGRYQIPEDGGTGDGPAS
ncbi:MAG: septation protein A [Alphaproteobacteria bacterium]